MASFTKPISLSQMDISVAFPYTRAEYAREMDILLMAEGCEVDPISQAI